MCLQTHGKVTYINNAQKQLLKKCYWRELSLKQISKLAPGCVYKIPKYQVYQNVISPTCESIFYLFEKAKYFYAKNLSIEEFWHESERLLSGLSTSLDLQIPPNLELILGNWYLASYKKMKHLESNCIWNFLLRMKFLKRVRWTVKIKIIIKIIAATFMNMNRWKWMLLAKYFFKKKTTLWSLFMDGVQLPQG